MTSSIVTLGTTLGPSRGGVALAPKEEADPTAEIAKLYDPKRQVEVVSYNMERFAKDCVTAFCELSGYPKAKVGTAPTPFLDESKDPVVIFDEPPATGTKGTHNKRPKSPVASKEGEALDKGKGSVKLPATETMIFLPQSTRPTMPPSKGNTFS